MICLTLYIYIHDTVATQIYLEEKEHDQATMQLKFGKPRAQPNATVKNVDGGGSVTAARMKVVVRKQELKNVMELVMRMNGSKAVNGHQIPTMQRAVSMEERMILLWRRKVSTGGGSVVRERGSSGGRHGGWQPVLQSIPEELYV